MPWMVRLHMDIDDTRDQVDESSEILELITIPEELREEWSMQAELDVRSAGLSHPGAVDVGIALWHEGLLAGIKWCRSQLDALDTTPRVCSACGQLWPADAFQEDLAECMQCAPIPV